MKNRILKIGGAVLGLLLLLGGPTAVFWVQWMMPSEGFPAGIGEAYHSEGNRDPALHDALTDILATARDEVGAPSITAAISMNGELVWAGASGYADIESRTVATADDLYRLGSTSKPLATIILGGMVDEGLVDMESTVGAIAPGLPEALHDATITQLASHTAGIRHYTRMLTWWPTWNETVTPKHYDSVYDGLSMFIDDDPLFEPGTDFTYSTFGYSLLAYLMEQAAGKSFEELLSQYLNGPLEMDLRLDDLTEDMPDRATTYMTEKGKWGAAYPADPSYKWAGGGIIARPRDLVMIGQALLADELMSPATRELFWTPVALPGAESNPQNYGIGWRIDTSIATLGEQAPMLMIHHGGRQMGGVAFWAIYPQLGISVATIANTGDGEARGAVQATAYALVRELVADL